MVLFFESLHSGNQGLIGVTLLNRDRMNLPLEGFLI